MWYEAAVPSLYKEFKVRTAESDRKFLENLEKFPERKRHVMRLILDSVYIINENAIQIVTICYNIKEAIVTLEHKPINFENLFSITGLYTRLKKLKFDLSLRPNLDNGVWILNSTNMCEYLEDVSIKCFRVGPDLSVLTGDHWPRLEKFHCNFKGRDEWTSLPNFLLQHPSITEVIQLIFHIKI